MRSAGRRASVGVKGGISAALKACTAAAAAASKPAPAVSAAKAAKGEKEPEKPGANAITPAKAPKGGGSGPGVTEDKLGMTLDDVIKTQDKKGARTSVKAVAPSKPPRGGRGVTEDKLGMTLDDVIKTQDSKKKLTENVRATAGKLLRGRTGIRQRMAARQERQATRVRRPTKQTMAPPKSMAVRRVRGRGAINLDREDDWEGGVRTTRAWDEPTNGSNGAFRGRRRAVMERDSWGPAPPAKRARVDDWDDWGSSYKGGGKGRKGGGKGDGYGDDGWGYGASSWSKGGGKGWGGGGGGDAWSAWSMPERRPRPEPMLQWDRAPQPPPVTRVMTSAPPAAVSRLARAERVERIEREERPERVERVERVEKAASTRKSIRVCNVPKNLDDRDIQEAFEDIGRVTKCEVERGVAVITFANSAHAKKAVQTFDRGELNGQTIYVSVEG